MFGKIVRVTGWIALGIYSVLRFVSDVMGIGDLFENPDKPLGLLDRGLNWLFATPWWVPALILLGWVIAFEILSRYPRQSIAQPSGNVGAMGPATDLTSARPSSNLTIDKSKIWAGSGAEGPGGHAEISGPGDVNIVASELAAGAGGPGGPGGDLIVKAGDGAVSGGWLPKITPPDPAKVVAIDEIYTALERALAVYDRGCDVVVGPWRAQVLRDGPHAYAEKLAAYRDEVSACFSEVGDLSGKKHARFSDIHEYRQSAFNDQGAIYGPFNAFIEILRKLPEKCDESLLDLIERDAETLKKAIGTFGAWVKKSLDIFRRMRGS